MPSGLKWGPWTEQERGHLERWASDENDDDVVGLVVDRPKSRMNPTKKFKWALVAPKGMGGTVRGKAEDVGEAKGHAEYVAFQNALLPMPKRQAVKRKVVAQATESPFDKVRVRRSAGKRPAARRALPSDPVSKVKGFFSKLFGG
jgi:hypothetical protein